MSARLSQRCCAVLFSGICLSAQAVLIDFESVDTGPMPVNALAAYGISAVTSSGGGTAPQSRDFSSEWNIVEPSGNRLFLPAGGMYPAPTGYFTTTLDFATPVTHFDFKKAADLAGTYGMAGWRADAYGASNTLVSSVGINLAGGLDFPSPTIQSYSLSGAEPITKIVFTTNYTWMSTSGTVLLDDFSFTPIPEPATCLAGAAALMLLRRTRR